jgi:putative transposase
MHAYVFMTNHVHLLITPIEKGSLSKTMQSICGRYVKYFNRTYRRTGTMWEGRYRATPIEVDRYLLACYRYIELNPVRARCVARPSNYPWSSYGANALGRPDPLVTPHERYLALGVDAPTRHTEYRALLATALLARTQREIRDATHKGWALGSARFRREIESLLDRRTEPLPRGRKASHGNGV